MPNKTTKSHDSEAIHCIPFIEYEYYKWMARKRMNRIVCALCVTNIAWLGLLAYIIFR